MASDTSGIIDIDARSLTELTEEMHRICSVKGGEEKELIEKLAKEIFTRYKTDISKSIEKEKEPKKEVEKEVEKEKELGFFEGLIKKAFSQKTPEEKAIEDAKKIEAEKIAEIENRIAMATNKLRSNQGVDSKQNDLNLMQDMIEVVEIASNSKVPSKVAEEARLAIGKVSLITGGSENTVKQEAYRETRESAKTGVSDFMRQNYQNKTTAVEFGPPVTPDQENIRNANYEKSSNALADRERKNQ